MVFAEGSHNIAGLSGKCGQLPEYQWNCLLFQTWVSGQMSSYHHLTGYKIIRKGKSNGEVQRKIWRHLKENQHGLPGVQRVGSTPLMAVSSEYILEWFFTNIQHQLIWGGSSSQNSTIPLDPAPEHWPREASWLPRPLQCVTLGCMSTTAALSPDCRTCPASEVSAPTELDPALQYPATVALHGRQTAASVQKRFNHLYSNH